MRHLLLTGAAGRIGEVLRAGLSGNADEMRLMDVVPLEAGPGEVAVQGGVRSLEDARRAAAGCDAVIHLAGSPRRRTSKRSWT